MRATIQKLRDRQRAPAIALRGMVRRLVVSLTSASGLWQLLGYEGLDGERETFNDVEQFQGVGFAARPKAGAGAEVIVAHVGGESGHPVGIASRDKSTQPELAEDETSVHNSVARLHVRADGTVHVTGADGTGGVALATKADLDALRSWMAAQFTEVGHTHAVSGAVTTGTTAVPAPGATPPSAAGTSVLRAK